MHPTLNFVLFVLLDPPDSTAPSTATQTASATSLTVPPSATGSSNAAPTNSQSSGSSSKKSSNIGPIVGGVVGGVAGLVIIGAIVFFVLRSRRNASGTQPTGPVDLTSNGNYGQYQQQYANYPHDMQYGEKSPGVAQSDPSQPLMANQRVSVSPFFTNYHFEFMLTALFPHLGPQRPIHVPHPRPLCWVSSSLHWLPCYRDNRRW